MLLARDTNKLMYIFNVKKVNYNNRTYEEIKNW